MIAANELRIGNCVNVLHGDVQIEKFIDGGVHFTDGNGGNFTSLSPIPLTPEILERCGQSLNMVNKGQPRLIDYCVVGLKKDGSHIVRLSSVLFEGLGICNIEYLHQLQNLYFALTGQELSVKVM